MLSSNDTVPSSTSVRDNVVFSDQPARASSPPSSPPGFPWEQHNATHNEPQLPPAPAISAFSVLGKRKALTDVSDNARPNKKAATASARPETKPVTQMQISLGQEVQKKCQTCGMEYVASSAEDRKLHDKYHKQNTEGYEVGKLFVQQARDLTVFEGADSADSICAIDCFDKHARKVRAHAVLDIVQRELGAVQIPKKAIWSYAHAGSAPRARAVYSCEPNYRVYMYIRGKKCVGFLLVEKITGARHVLEPQTAMTKRAENAISAGAAGALSLLKARRQAAENAAREAAARPIQLSGESHPAKLGISRIWTSPQHRHQNIASAMLDAAVTHHNQRAERQQQQVETMRAAHNKDLSPIARNVLDEVMKPLEKLRGKEDMAFSQPTEAGARLARRWFGRLYGWGVYVE